MSEHETSKTGKALNALFDAGALWPLAALAVILGLQTVFTLNCRELWYSDEVRYANVLQQLLEKGKWIVLYLNGEPYPDKPPVYFWLLASIKAMIGHTRPALFFLGSAVSGYLYVAATYLFSRRVVGMDRKSGFGCGLVMLSTFYFVGVSHYSRMDLLFSALITMSHLFLFKAWQREKATGAMLAGFFFAAIATLTKGPLGIVFPLAASIVYLVWAGRPLRLLRRDVLLGLLLAVAILGAWVAGAYFTEEEAFLRNIFQDQIYKRAVDTWHHGHPFYHYFATLPLAWLPWTLLLFLVPWPRLMRASMWRGVWAARKDEPGLTYAWIVLLSGFAILSAVSIKIIIYLLPLFAPLAVVSVRSILGMRGAGENEERKVRADRFWKSVAIVFALVAAVVPFANYMHPWPVVLEGLLPVAAGSAALAFIFWKVVPHGAARGGVLLLALGVTGWIYLVGAFAAPSLDPAMSPKAQAEVMRDYIAKDYYPVSLKVYSGTYTYYAGQDILEVKSYEDLEQVLGWQDKIVLGTKKKYWEGWENRPAGLKVVHEQWIVDQPYVLAITTQNNGAGPMPISGALETTNATASANATALPPSPASQNEEIVKPEGDILGKDGEMAPDGNQ